MKGVLAAFNQEKALLRDCTTSPMDRFAALTRSVCPPGRAGLDDLIVARTHLSVDFRGSRVSI